MQSTANLNAWDLLALGRPDLVEMKVKQCLNCGSGPFNSMSEWLNHICQPYTILELNVAPGTNFLEPLHGKQRWACCVPEKKSIGVV